MATTHDGVCFQKTKHLFSNIVCTTSGQTGLEIDHGRDLLPLSGLGVASSLGKVEPWTHDSVCSAFFHAIGASLCVYTCSWHAHGQGISIITTPARAETFAAIIQSQAAQSSREKAGLTQLYQLPTKHQRVLKASRGIRDGETVAMHSPAVVSQVETDWLSWQEREALLRVAFSQLPTRTQESLSLFRAWQGGALYFLAGVMGTNSGFMMDVDGQEYATLLPSLSLLNHHCAPNSIFHFDSKSMVLSIQAVRPVAIDEEITISSPQYVGLTIIMDFESFPEPATHALLPYVERQPITREVLGTQCSCKKCLQGDTTDGAARAILDLETLLVNSGSNNVEVVTDGIDRLRELYAEEGLQAYMERLYNVGAEAYAALNEFGLAQKYRNLATAFVESKGFVAYKSNPSIRA